MHAKQQKYINLTDKNIQKNTQHMNYFQSQRICMISCVRCIINFTKTSITVHNINQYNVLSRNELQQETD